MRDKREAIVAGGGVGRDKRKERGEKERETGKSPSARGTGVCAMVGNTAIVLEGKREDKSPARDERRAMASATRRLLPPLLARTVSAQHPTRVSLRFVGGTRADGNAHVRPRARARL